MRTSTIKQGKRKYGEIAGGQERLSAWVLSAEINFQGKFKFREKHIMGNQINRKSQIELESMNQCEESERKPHRQDWFDFCDIFEGNCTEKSISEHLQGSDSKITTYPCSGLS